MNLTETLLQQLENPHLTASERVLLRCSAAADFIHRGQYEAACDVLGELWQGVGQRPEVKGLKKPAAAEVLLQCGALSSGIGHARNIRGAQHEAKNLISEAQRLFEEKWLPVKVAEAQSELSICYWRMGAFDDARVMLDKAATVVGDKNNEVRARILIRRALVEIWACRYHDALIVLKKAEEFFMKLPDPIKGRWHTQMGLVLRRLGSAEGRTDYIDRAIIEYIAAIYHYEQSQNDRYCALTLNNLAFLLYRVGKSQEAHEHLDRAGAIFSKLHDPGNLAQVNETRARVLMSEHRYEEAKNVIASSVQVFEEGGDQACLADALTIQATVLARLHDYERSLVLFRRAIEIAANAGAPGYAGHAALSMIEEHGESRLTEYEIYAAYRSADEYLKDTQDTEDIARLRACAQIVIRRLIGTQLLEKDFLLPKALHSYEARFIETALSRSGGKISQAAKMLGLSHQALSSILKNRHKNLRNKRLPPASRRRKMARDEGQEQQQEETKTISILYVEDNRDVAETVKETLEQEGFSVEVIRDGSSALGVIKSKKQPFDLLIFDNDLPGVNGIELARWAREFPHRQRTPIILFSASDVAAAAYRAGVNLFLQKPEEVLQLADSIKHLLSGN